MPKLKSVLLSLTSFALVAALAIGGTVAYLQDTDEDVNVMTLGNVYIDQIEEQLAEDGVTKEPFEQAKELYPGTEVSKIVTVKNTGKSDAYFRTLIAFEDIDSETFGLDFPISDGYRWSWGAPEATIVIDGVTYQVYEALYTGVLAAGETSPASLTKVKFATTCTNEDMEALGGSYEILVLSQAVQTEGFENAQTALETAFGKTSDKAAEWFEGVKIPVIADKNAESKVILDALKNGQDVYVDEDVDIIAFDDEEIDGKGATVNLEGQGAGAYGYLGFVPEAGEDITVSNVKVSGSGFVEVGHYGMGGGDYIVNNLVVTDLKATVPVTDGANRVSPAFCHYGNAVLNDCVMTGATTVDATAKAYDAGFVNGTNTNINGGEYGKIYLWSQAHVTINGAEIGEIDSSAITRNNLGMLTIGAGTHVGTINITCSNSYTPALTIEEGATVDAIVYKGVTYTQAEWLAH